jgi:hypothetical protein
MNLFTISFFVLVLYNVWQTLRSFDIKGHLAYLANKVGLLSHANYRLFLLNGITKNDKEGDKYNLLIELFFKAVEARDTVAIKSALKKIILNSAFFYLLSSYELIWLLVCGYHYGFRAVLVLLFLKLVMPIMVFLNQNALKWLHLFYTVLFCFIGYIIDIWYKL